MATSCFWYVNVPSDVHCHRFKWLFVLQLFFWFHFALDTKHAAFAPLCCTWTCEESWTDRSVRECDYVWWSHQSIHQFLMPQQPRMKFITVLSSPTTCSWLLSRISCIALLVLFEVFLQWILANGEQETGMCLRHETAVQLWSESVVVGGTVLHTHAYEGEGPELRRQSWLAVLENAWSWSVLIGVRMKGAVCNLISKKALFL